MTGQRPHHIIDFFHFCRIYGLNSHNVFCYQTLSVIFFLCLFYWVSSKVSFLLPMFPVDIQLLSSTVLRCCNSSLCFILCFLIPPSVLFFSRCIPNFLEGLLSPHDALYLLIPPPCLLVCGCFFT